jgi:hypothetical protein
VDPAQHDPELRQDGSWEGPSKEALELSRRCTAHRTAMENFILPWHVTFWILRRMGIDPSSRLGRTIMALLVAAAIIAAPLAATAITGEWSAAPIVMWCVVGATFAALGVEIYPFYVRCIGDHLALHRAIRNEEELRQLLAWMQRWFHVRASAPIALVISGATLAVLLLLQHRTGEAALPAGTVVIGGILIYQVAEVTYTVVLNGIESRRLASSDYALFGLSPIDSVPIRCAVRGYNRVALGHSMVATLFLIEFLMLLPASSPLTPWVALVLLAMVYFGVAFGNVLPRLGMQRIVQAEKDRRLARVQERLNQLAGRMLSPGPGERLELHRLLELHDRICASSENLLPLATVGNLVGTLLAPTLVFVLAVAGEVYLERLLERFAR